MLKIVSDTGEWNIIINKVEYNFYYSNSKPIEGLLLNGSEKQEKTYKIGNYEITAEKEDYIHSKSGYRYILNIATK